MNKFEKVSKKQYDLDAWGGKHMADYDDIKLPHRATKCSADYYNNSNNEGHIWVKITNDSKRGDTLVVNKGDAIAQGIILEYFKTDDDNADGVRNGGLGSTSK